MFIEDDKRKRRAIANSNERRRMQSINAGFQTLKSLIPHSSGEKLSKACILQRSADFMQFLSNEKDKLANKMHIALKILDANGLINQFQTDHANMVNPTMNGVNKLNFSVNKSSASTTKINKQYVSSYNNNCTGPNKAVTDTTSLLSLASLTESVSDDIGSSSSSSSVKKIVDIEEKQPTVVLGTQIPIQNVAVTLNRTQIHSERKYIFFCYCLSFIVGNSHFMVQ